MTMADVSCASCGHKMSYHKDGDCTYEGCEVVVKAPCHLGPARRDDLTDRIDELEETLEYIKNNLTNLLEVI